MPESPRILIVEDDPAGQDLARRTLAKLGYTLDVASDGLAALDLVARHVPDLVITDVMMPRMDGWALVRILRSRAETAFIPVIFLTALDSSEHRIRGYRLGADDFLAKPFSPRELDARVQRQLQRAGRLKDEMRAAVANTKEVQGSLEQIGLSTLLVMLEMEKRSCSVLLQHRNESGCLFVWQGKVHSAIVNEYPTMFGADCVYHLLRWYEGFFSLSPLDHSVTDEIRMSTAELLLEGARRMDEAQKP